MRRAILAAGYALATFLAFPQALGESSIDLGIAFAPLAPALLLLAGAGLAPRRAAALGFAAGLVAHCAVLYWIYIVTVRYGHAPAFFGGLAVAGLASYVAIFTGLFSSAWAWLAERDLDNPLAVAALWTALDHLRSFALTGFPWATLGYAWHDNALLAGFVPITGVYGLSFAAALTGAVAADAIRGRSRRAAFSAVLVAAIHGAGLALAPDELDADSPTLRVAVLQGNIEQGVKWSPEWADRSWEIYASLTRAAAAQGAEVVVWPETAAPGSPDASLELRGRLSELARRNEVTLVAGAVGIEGFDPVAERPSGPVRYFDSAFVVSPAGEFLDRYDKTHLVPFGEYVPLRDLVGRFVKAIATGVASGDVSPGERPRSVLLPPVEGGDGAEPRVSAGVPICYELLFPDLVRRFVGSDGGGGARVLFAITNDAWYGRTGAPYQFLVMTAMRSAESRIWTARAANTGVSAFIDSRGRVRERTRIFERDFLVADVPLRAPDEQGTFYVRHGDRFAQACWLGLVFAGVIGVTRTRGGPMRQEGARAPAGEPTSA